MNYNTKTLSIGIILTMILLFLVGKIGYIQVVKGEEYKKMAIIQQVSKIDKAITPVRGSILDRNNYEIAVSRRLYNIAIDSKNFSSQKEPFKQKQISIMSKTLDIPEEDIKEALKSNTHYKIIKKAVLKEVVDKLKEEKLENLIYEDTYKRKYMYGDFASNIIGFANETVGLWGIEKQYNSYLSGTEGRRFITFKGNNMLVQDQIQARDGYNVVLTIDKNIQDILEKNLKEAVAKHDPKNAALIAMDPSTGEILGLANYPSFDLNNPMEIKDEEKIKKLQEFSDISKEEKLNILWRNFAINDGYEPGSVFKAVTVAAGLEEMVTTPNDNFYCSGVKVVSGKPIKCAEVHGHQTLEEALAESCNVAMMDIAEKLTKEKFYYYQKLFGFGQLTGIDISGESRGLLHKVEKAVPIDLATDSFGQGFTVTPIQMISAFASVINGGNLIRPHLVSQVVDNERNVIAQNNPTIIRKTISKKTSDLVRIYLESVVTKGTGSKALVEGYRVGGKTGTSEKLPRGSGKYVASFMGFAPVDNPKVIILSIVDEPTGTYYGGSVAAPVAQVCLEEILKYMGLPKTEEINKNTSKINLKNQMLMLQDYMNKNVIDAALTIKNENIKYKIIGNGSRVVNQAPKPNTLVPLDREILLYVEPEKEDVVPIPNLMNMTYEQASEAVGKSGLLLRTSAKGNKVIEQIPSAGSKIETGAQVYVKFN